MKKIFIVVFGGCLFIFVLLMFLGAISQKGTPVKNDEQILPTKVPIGRPESRSNKPINDLQNVIAGVTTQEDVKKIPGIVVVSETNTSGVYALPSIINSRPHKISTRAGFAVDERIVLPEREGQEGFATISSITEKYGQPERVLAGSSFYGDYTSRYLYPAKGLFFIVNTNTNEVFEILHFTPMNLADFVNNYPEETTTIPRGVEAF